MKLTELEKTILLVFLVFTKGSVDKYLQEDFIASKFTKRQRPIVRSYLRRLSRDGLLEKHPTEASYKLVKLGLKHASKILHEGTKLWKM
ncbi:MAG: hypothetical protein QMD36_00690 [Candidatus Aenigmarchaeota archaeon]|nr:hypothetical protein [Candidatus Aenigmarchaeota archaeon]